MPLYTRQDLIDLISRLGFELTFCQVFPDAGSPWIAPSLDGSTMNLDVDAVRLKHLDADQVEELAGHRVVLTGRPAAAAPDCAPSCTVILHREQGCSTQPAVDCLQSSTGHGNYELLSVEYAVGNRMPDDGRLDSLASAVNEAARLAHGRYLLIMTSDSRPEAALIESLTAVIKADPSIGAVSPRILNPDGTIYHAGLAFGPPHSPYNGLPYRIYADHGATSPHVMETRDVQAATADCVVVARRSFVEIGGFDERFATDLAEADLCLRLRARGLRVMYLASPSVTRTKPTPSRREQRNRREALDFHAKWYGRLTCDDASLCRRHHIDLVQARVQGRHHRVVARNESSWESSSVLWTCEYNFTNGYADEARAFLSGLRQLGVDVVVDPLDWVVEPLGQSSQELSTSSSARYLREPFIHVLHCVPHEAEANLRAGARVARTMFETDRLPRPWVSICNQMDEVWVPSDFNIETFAHAGVNVAKLHKVQECLQVDRFDPSTSVPLFITGLRGFIFLSVGAAWKRKGWDLLVRAYCEEFKADEEVTLLLKCGPRVDRTRVDYQTILDQSIPTRLKRHGRLPQVVLHTDPLRGSAIHRLYATADAFVLPSHGEGWGRPYMEAMAMGLPTIGTRWSGNLEFMDESNSYLIDCALAEVPEAAWGELWGYSGHRWAEPSLEHLRETMRWVFEHREEASRRGLKARADILDRFDSVTVAGQIKRRLDAVGGGAKLMGEEEHPRQAQILHAVSQLQRSHRFRDAELMLGKALRDGGEEPAYHFRLGDALAAQEQWQSAAAAYMSGLQLDRNNPSCLAKLGCCLLRISQFESAEHVFEAALILRPSHAFAATGLAAARKRSTDDLQPNQVELSL
jgi:glycosyltransferase involved in cell wall biosynthesis